MFFQCLWEDIVEETLGFSYKDSLHLRNSYSRDLRLMDPIKFRTEMNQREMDQRRESNKRYFTPNIFMPEGVFQKTLNLLYSIYLVNSVTDRSQFVNRQ